MHTICIYMAPVAFWFTYFSINRWVDLVDVCDLSVVLVGDCCLCLKPDLRVSSTKWLSALRFIFCSLCTWIMWSWCRISFWCYSESLFSVLLRVSLWFWAGMSAQTSPLAAAAVTQLWGEVGTALSSASTQVLCTCRPALAPSSHILAVRSEHLRRERLSGACESLQTCKKTHVVSVWHDSRQHIPHDDLQCLQPTFLTTSMRSCSSFSCAAMRFKWRTRLRLFDQKYCKNGNIVKKKCTFKKNLK